MTHEPGTAAPRGRRGLLLVLCLALAAALAAFAIVTVAAWTEDPPASGYGSAAERAQIDGVAEQFALNVGTYGPSDLKDGTMPDYRRRVGSLLTTKFRATFEEQVKAVEAIVAQSKLQVKAKINAVGVAAVDGDRATAFVAWETSGRYDKAAYGDPRQTRSKVTLVRVKGEWRVDDFTPVTGEETK